MSSTLALRVQDDSSPLDQVVHEIEMMKALRHDGLVKLHEAFEDHSAVYMVMEMLGGVTLQQPAVSDIFIWLFRRRMMLTEVDRT
jgi:serine/threonine protein kinase